MDTSDWMELGAGFGMGTAMSHAIGDSFMNAIDARTSVGIITIPQTAQEIQTLLDKLDVRLANGEISEDIYKQITFKWQKRLEEAERA
jgi:hypothetical protein